jgi:hypothetical protein
MRDASRIGVYVSASPTGAHRGVVVSVDAVDAAAGTELRWTLVAVTSTTGAGATAATRMPRLSLFGRERSQLCARAESAPRRHHHVQ